MIKKVKPINLLLESKYFDGIKLYEGVPSVTSVLGIMNMNNDLEIYKRNNPEEFKAMLNRKAAAGTILHGVIEKTYKDKRLYISPTVHNNSWKQFYYKEGINWEAIELECFVGDNKVAGTFDAIMKIKGEEYVCDWKTYGGKTYPELIYKYKLQISKYQDLVNKKNENRITTNPKIILFGPNKEYKLFEIIERRELILEYNNLLKIFYEYYNIYLSYNLKNNDKTN